MIEDSNWYLVEDEQGDIFVCGSGGLVCDMDGGTEQDERKAKHIVKCVNYHDRLVEALDRMILEFGDWDHDLGELKEKQEPCISDADRLVSEARGYAVTDSKPTVISVLESFVLPESHIKPGIDPRLDAAREVLAELSAHDGVEG